LEEDSGTLASLNNLDEEDQRTVGGVIGRTGEPEIAADGSGDLLTLFREGGDVDPNTVERLNELRDAGELSDGEINKLVDAYETGTIDGSDLRRVSKLLNDNTGSNQAYLAGEKVDATDLLNIEDSGGDLSQTVSVVKRNSDVKWMETGGNSVGWRHIKGRHIYGDLNKQRRTTFFETGEEIVRGSKAKTLDSEMSETEVQKLINKAIRKGIPDEDDNAEVYVYESSEYKMNVRVVLDEQGKVITAYPEEGPNVPTWKPGSGWGDDD